MPLIIQTKDEEKLSGEDLNYNSKIRKTVGIKSQAYASHSDSCFYLII